MIKILKRLGAIATLGAIAALLITLVAALPGSGPTFDGAGDASPPERSLIGLPTAEARVGGSYVYNRQSHTVTIRCDYNRPATNRNLGPWSNSKKAGCTAHNHDVDQLDPRRDLCMQIVGSPFDPVPNGWYKVSNRRNDGAWYKIYDLTTATLYPASYGKCKGRPHYKWF